MRGVIWTKVTTTRVVFNKLLFVHVRLEKMFSMWSPQHQRYMHILEFITAHQYLLVLVRLTAPAGHFNGPCFRRRTPRSYRNFLVQESPGDGMKDGTSEGLPSFFRSGKNLPQALVCRTTSTVLSF